MASDAAGKYAPEPGQAQPHTGSVRPAVVLDFLERAGWSAGEVFFATLLAGGLPTGDVIGLPWKYSLVLALGAAVSSVLLTLGQYVAKLTDLSGLNPPWLRFWADLAIRLVKTFVASVVGSVVAAHPFDIVTFNWTSALNVAVLAVLAALGKCLLARGAGGTSAGAVPTPSTLPTPTYLAAVRPPRP